MISMQVKKKSVLKKELPAALMAREHKDMQEGYLALSESRETPSSTCKAGCGHS